jgi:23S rRNA pseudouridine2605 synthase
MMPAVEERLQKVLARAGFASRRGAEQLIREGRVTVNGAVVHQLGTKADPSRDDVRVDGVRVRAGSVPAYLVLNKPRGVVTTRRDPSGRTTVMDLVPGVAGLFPVGRLDVTTEGLILLTNDGAFAQRVAHPRYEVRRVYHAKVHGVPDPRALDRLRRGIRVEGERLKADGVRVLEAANNAWVELVLHEGRQHEVKRLLAAAGHPVAKLRRVAIGPVVAPDLQPGQFRTLRAEEIAGLMRGSEGKTPPLRRPARRPRHERRNPARRPSTPGPRGGRKGGRAREGRRQLGREQGSPRRPARGSRR